MAHVRFVNVECQFDLTKAVKGLTFEVEQGELLAIVGPSGSGKTTTLRLIAGLESPTLGEIYIGNDSTKDIPASRRNVSMVFQDLALFPHLTVYQNMAFGISGRRELESSLRQTADSFSIRPLLDRFPEQLSGGEQQRVALARAFARQPEVLLLDEPFSNLDGILRETLRRLLRDMQRASKTTTILVTHDQAESLELGDRIGVMLEGRLHQIDQPNAVFDQPSSLDIARFWNAPRWNLAEGTWLSDSHGMAFECSGFRIEGFGKFPYSSAVIGGRAWVGFLPTRGSIQLAASGSPKSNDLVTAVATVSDTQSIGDEYRIQLSAPRAENGIRWHLVGPRRLASDREWPELKPGMEVRLMVREVDLRWFDSVTGQRL